MATTSTILAAARDEFDELIKNIRPKLHRYCARMTGSVVEAEDVVQDALGKAYYLLSTTEVTNLEGWLFRIAHNKAIDFLREAKNSPIDFVEEYPPQGEVASPLENEEVTKLAVSIYLQLTPMQRSCVVLKDVIGYSLSEVSEMLDVSVGAIKAALHRGRENLRDLANKVDDNVPLPLDEPETKLLSMYVERFNARDFDAIRAMLTDDVRLDLVERLKTQGAVEVGKYFHNYSRIEDWRLTLGFVERRPAILVSDIEDPRQYIYIILIQWDQQKVALIRDYRYARLVMLDADIEVVRDGK